MFVPEITTCSGGSDARDKCISCTIRTPLHKKVFPHISGYAQLSAQHKKEYQDEMKVRENWVRPVRPQ